MKRKTVNLSVAIPKELMREIPARIERGFLMMSISQYLLWLVKADLEAQPKKKA